MIVVNQKILKEEKTWHRHTVSSWQQIIFVYRQVICLTTTSFYPTRRLSGQPVKISKLNFRDSDLLTHFNILIGRKIISKLGCNIVFTLFFQGESDSNGFIMAKFLMLFFVSPFSPYLVKYSQEKKTNIRSFVIGQHFGFQCFGRNFDFVSMSCCWHHMSFTH